MRVERGVKGMAAASGRKKETIGPLGLLSHDGAVARFSGALKIVAADEAKERGKVTARTSFSGVRFPSRRLECRSQKGN